MIEIETITDIPSLLEWRKEVIENVFGIQPDANLMAANRDYYEKHVADGTHIAIVARYNGDDAGCGAICLTDELPSPDNMTGHCAYVMNIYVRSEFREHGIAHAIVSRLIEEARNRNCGKIYLETTDEGRPVYTSLGFTDFPDIMKLHNHE